MNENDSNSASSSDIGCGTRIIIWLVCIILMFFSLKACGVSNSSSSSSHDDEWRCPTCHSWVSDKLDWCPNCVKNAFR